MKFFELIEFLITEAMSAQALKKHYNDISDEDYEKIVALDPTAEGEYVGTYTNWLLGLYRKKKLDVDDAETREALERFENMDKSDLTKKKINKYKDVEELKSVVTGETGKAKSDYLDLGSKVVYKDHQWLIEQPVSYEQSCNAYGDENHSFDGKEVTLWCTAGRFDSDSYWKDYNAKGDLYVIRGVDSRIPKAQVHVVDNDITEVMNDRNVSIIPDSRFPNSVDKFDEFLTNQPKIKAFFKKLAPEYFGAGGNILKFAGKRFKFTVRDDGVRVFKDIDLSDRQLETIPNFMMDVETA